MSEQDTEVNHKIVSVTPAPGKESINIVPPTSALLICEEFIKRYQYDHQPPTPLLSTPSPPHENRIALSDKYKCFRRKIQPKTTRDPRQSIRLQADRHLEPRHNHPIAIPYANGRSYRETNVLSSPAVQQLVKHFPKENFGDFYHRQALCVTSAKTTTATNGQIEGKLKSNEITKETYRDHRRRQELDMQNAELHIVKLIKSRGDGKTGSRDSSTTTSTPEIAHIASGEKEQEVCRFKTPTENDYIFGFRGDVFMDLLKMKLGKENPQMKYGSAPNFEYMKLKAFQMFLESKIQNDDTVSEIYQYTIFELKLPFSCFILSN